MLPKLGCRKQLSLRLSDSWVLPHRSPPAAAQYPISLHHLDSGQAACWCDSRQIFRSALTLWSRREDNSFSCCVSFPCVLMTSLSKLSILYKSPKQNKQDRSEASDEHNVLWLSSQSVAESSPSDIPNRSRRSRSRLRPLHSTTGRLGRCLGRPSSSQRGWTPLIKSEDSYLSPKAGFSSPELHFLRTGVDLRTRTS